MKLNKIKAIAPAVALLLAATMSSCMNDLDKLSKSELPNTTEY